jgi:hypothetical protein
VTTAQLAIALFDATTARIAEAPGFGVTIAIDGTALSLTDAKLTKEFGPVGRRTRRCAASR